MASDWSERTARSTRRSRPPANVAFELSVIDGPDAGKTFAIEPSVVTFVGHSKLCAIALADDTVAPRHCSLESTGTQLRIVAGEDPRFPPAKVNGVCAREAFLLGGEIIRLGQSALVVRRKSAHETTAADLRAFGRVAGESGQMRALYNIFATLAHERTPLAIHGERGTGKRLLAEELHAHGPFQDGPFVVVPRRAPIAPFLPLAKGGTLYVEDAAPEQASELEGVPCDVRVIVGARGRFEAPGLAHVTLPPLREREGDVAILARHFWARLGGEGGLPDDFIARVAERAWPGNCRELRIAVEDRLRHGADETVSDIVEIASGSHASSAPGDAIADVVDRDLALVPARHEILAEFERRYVDHALEKAGHNVARAAANSGIAHRYFQVLKSRRKNA
jgi:hypothetical protein